MKTRAFIKLRSGRSIGEGLPCFIVAEIGNNHQGEFDLALRMIEAAAEAGADAVKFQKRDTASLLTREAFDAPYTGPNSFGATYGEHRLALELSVEEMARLKQAAEDLGMIFFASVWDPVSLEQIVGLDVELLKIASADLANVPLLRRAAGSGLPLIVSTGMSDLQEIDGAVRELTAHHDRIILLHCNSTYPCPEEEIALPVMLTLRRRYNLPVGYSGHERDISPSLGAVALGACVVERHFTLDRAMRGTDHQASLDPVGFKSLAEMVRDLEKSMQVKEKRLFAGEVAAARKLRKSVAVVRDLPAGHMLTEDDLCVKSPGTGISPIYWDKIVGAVLGQSVRREQLLSWEVILPRAEASAIRAVTP